MKLNMMTNLPSDPADFPTSAVQQGRAKPKAVLSPDAADSPALIVGAGIAGTACALALSDLGIESVMLDQRPLETIGGGMGINLQGKAIKALQSLGITTKSLIDSGVPITKQSYYTSDGRHVCTIDKSSSGSSNNKDASSDGIPGQLAIRRGKLLQLLHDAAVASKRIKLLANHRFVDINKTASSGMVQIKAEATETSNKKPIALDGFMVLGADGIGSQVRNHVVAGNSGNSMKGGDRRFHGVTHYRGVVENFPKFLDGSTMIVAGGLHTKVVVYPVGPTCEKGLQTTNWVVAIEEEEANGRPSSHCDHILSTLSRERFGLDFLDLSLLISKTSSIQAWPMVDLVPLDTWTDGRVGLVGDAAHAMLPVGSGGAMAALFDALALREAFEKSGSVSAEDVLRLYQSMRYKDASRHQHNCKLQPAEHVVQEVMDHIPLISDVPSEYADRIRTAMKQLHQPPKSAEDKEVETKNRVLIVGAGASGLTACKEFTEKGFTPVVFESGETFGGVFRDCYKHLVLTSSSAFTAYSDYPPREERPTMWTASEYLSYLHRYSVDNDVFRHIKFRSTVVGIRRIPNKIAGSDTLWEVEVFDSMTGKTTVMRGGHLVLCVGSNATPSRPTFSGQDKYSGEIIHTSDLHGFEMFQGKRVLCLGLGESGSDVPYWIAKQPGASVTIATRGLGWCVPRRRPLKTGLPTDLNTNRLLWGMPRIFNLILSFILAFFDAFFDSDPVIRRMGRLNLKHPVGVYKTYGTKSVNFLAAIEQLGSKLVGSTIRAMGPGDLVQFEDGSEDHFDIVLLNTGYTKSTFEGFCFPPSMEDKRDDVLYNVLSEASYVRHLYKRVFHPAMKNLYFIGFARPGFGSIPSIAETQARWAASVAAKSSFLPSEDTMISEIAADKARDETQFDSAARRVTTLVDYVPYVNDIASLLGVPPPYLKLLLTDPLLLLKIFFGPATVVQFRLRGPGAKPDIATSTIRGYPPIPMRRLTFITLGMYLMTLLVNFLSLAVPITLAARKRLQPVGFPPLRSMPLLFVRYAMFVVHLASLGYWYAKMSGEPIIRLSAIAVICSLEIHGYLERKSNEKCLRSKLTSSAEASGVQGFHNKNKTTKMTGASMMAKDEQKAKPTIMRSHPGAGLFSLFTMMIILAMFGTRRFPIIFASAFRFGGPRGFRGWKIVSEQRQQANNLPPLLTTKAGGSLMAQFTKVHDFTPLERVTLTASGNLQKLFSAYYNEPVEVSVEHFEPEDLLPDNDDNDRDVENDGPAAVIADKNDHTPLAVFSRRVSLKMDGRAFCKATSRVRVYSPVILDLLMKKQIGIGQLFQYMNMRPEFALHDAGRNHDDGLWRLYTLDCHDMIECDILEEFTPNAWNMKDHHSGITGDRIVGVAHSSTNNGKKGGLQDRMMVPAPPTTDDIDEWFFC